MYDVDTEKFGDLRRRDKSGNYGYERANAESRTAEAQNLFQIQVSAFGRIFSEYLNFRGKSLEELFQRKLGFLFGGLLANCRPFFLRAGLI